MTVRRYGLKCSLGPICFLLVVCEDIARKEPSHIKHGRPLYVQHADILEYGHGISGFHGFAREPYKEFADAAGSYRPVPRLHAYIILGLVSCCRPALLCLAQNFESKGGWGLERTFASWSHRQPWRKLLPLVGFEYPGCIDCDCFTRI